MQKDAHAQCTEEPSNRSHTATTLMAVQDKACCSISQCHLPCSLGTPQAIAGFGPASLLYYLPCNRPYSCWERQRHTLSCARVTWPTLAELGVAEPLATPAAFCSSTDAGGVFRMNVKLRSCTAADSFHQHQSQSPGRLAKLPHDPVPALIASVISDRAGMPAPCPLHPPHAPARAG